MMHRLRRFAVAGGKKTAGAFAPAEGSAVGSAVLDGIDGLLSRDAGNGEEGGEKSHAYADGKHQDGLSWAVVQKCDGNTFVVHQGIRNEDACDHNCRRKHEVDECDYQSLAEEDLEDVGGAGTHGTKHTDLSLFIGNGGCDEIH